MNPEETQESSQTTILIQKPESIDAFVKLMLTTKLAFAKSGIYSGVPPTLLCSSAFDMGIQRKLTVIFICNMLV